ncbi:unnamed protein product, partial [Ectocarpus sp. 8 AP-2014]
HSTVPALIASSTHKVEAERTRCRVSGRGDHISANSAFLNSTPRGPDRVAPGYAPAAAEQGCRRQRTLQNTRGMSQSLRKRRSTLSGQTMTLTTRCPARPPLADPESAVVRGAVLVGANERLAARHLRGLGRQRRLSAKEVLGTAAAPAAAVTIA